MKKLLKRGLLGAAAITIPLGASLALPAVAASAAPGAAQVTTSVVATDGQTLTGTINANVDVPSGVTATFAYAHVTGNVSVEGNLGIRASQLDRNLNVNGGSFVAYNQASSITGNVSITNSPGPSGSQNGFFSDAGQSTVGGNFSYTYNSGRLYVGNAGLHVQGNFSFANNTGGSDLGGLDVSGHQTIS
jgi:hypothetical protein